MVKALLKSRASYHTWLVPYAGCLHNTCATPMFCRRMRYARVARHASRFIAGDGHHYAHYDIHASCVHILAPRHRYFCAVHILSASGAP